MAKLFAFCMRYEIRKVLRNFPRASWSLFPLGTYTSRLRRDEVHHLAEHH